jgi:hypothetical protein
VVTLQGTIKGETNDRDHLLPCVLTTSLGVDVKASLERLVLLKATNGFTDGPAISDLAGHIFSTKDMTGFFWNHWRICLIWTEACFLPTLFQRISCRNTIMIFGCSAGLLTAALQKRTWAQPTQISSIDGSWLKERKEGGQRCGCVCIIRRLTLS